MGLEELNTQMSQNACLCKYSHKRSNLGLNWKQTAEKENMFNGIQAALKVTAV